LWIQRINAGTREHGVRAGLRVVGALIAQLGMRGRQHNADPELVLSFCHRTGVLRCVYARSEAVQRAAEPQGAV
jgi:hypothetical protein